MHLRRLYLESATLGATPFFHGSPYTGITSFASVRAPIFFTPDRNVAMQYASGPIVGAQRNSGFTKGATIYTVSLSGLRVFDMRNKDHQQIYIDARKAQSPKDPEDQLPKIDSEGFLMSHTRLPGYGFVRMIWRLIKELGQFDAIWIDEGTQGKAIAAFDSLDKIVISDTLAV